MLRRYDTSELSPKDTILRLRQLYAEIAEHEQKIRKLEAQLPLEEQFRLTLMRASRRLACTINPTEKIRLKRN